MCVNFTAPPSTYLWQDDMDVVHEVHQGEGGEQGDTLMPALFSLGQPNAWVAVQQQLGHDERLFAFLDDIYVTSRLDRVVPIFNVLRRELWTHARIQIHLGKTKCRGQTSWLRRVDDGRSKERPRCCGVDTLYHQINIVLGTPLGSAEFVQCELASLSAKHQSLLDGIHQVQDLQSVWLLLLFCAVPRPNYVLRMLHPDVTRVFAAQHDCSIRRCLEQFAAHNRARQVVDCGHPTTGNGWVGSEERFERQKSLILVQLGQRFAHDSPTSPFGAGIHVGDVEQ